MHAGEVVRNTELWTTLPKGGMGGPRRQVLNAREVQAPRAARQGQTHSKTQTQPSDLNAREVQAPCAARQGQNDDVTDEPD